MQTKPLLIALGSLLILACSGESDDTDPKMSEPAQNDGTMPGEPAEVADQNPDAENPTGTDEGTEPAAENVDGDADEGSGEVTSTAPALCESDADCPEGIACVVFEDSDVGFCDVEEATAAPEVPETDDSDSVSLAAPAMCITDGDCPEGISCIRFDETGPGHCDVSEMAAGSDPGQ